VVSLEGLKGQLLLGLNALLSQLLDFSGENGSRSGGGIDTVGLDGDNDTTTNLEEQMGVQADDTSLITVHGLARHDTNTERVNVRLGNISKDAVDHADEHAVLQGVTGILNDGDDIGPVGSHVDKITARAVGEFDSEDGSLGANNIGNVGNGGAGSGTEIENLRSGLHVNGINATEDTSSQLRLCAH
jgi:hypothetical protein